VDVRADIYALGGSAVLVLDGREPVCTAGDGAGRHGVPGGESPAVCQSSPAEISEELDAVVRRMLAPRTGRAFSRPPMAVSPGLAAISGSTSFRVDPRLRGAARRGRTLSRRGRRISASAYSSWTTNAPCVGLCRLALEGKGVVCVEAADGQEALDALERRAFDLVVTDWTCRE